jgi:hypothetical protein
VVKGKAFDVLFVYVAVDEPAFCANHLGWGVTEQETLGDSNKDEGHGDFEKRDIR